MRRRPSRLVLLGHPVHHSLSPRFQNAALRAARIPLVYEAVDVASPELAQCVVSLRDSGAAGNVTIPHKEAVAAICDTLTSDARGAGAVNTFWVEDGRLVGDNTDIGGFTAATRALLGGSPENLRIAILGAGGAARAVICAAAAWPDCTVVIHNRTSARATALVAQRGAPCEIAGSALDAVRGADLVVNATSIGLHDDAMPVSVEALSRGCAVLDLVYRPGETAFVRAARSSGHRAADGLTMLVEQGALAFERWFGFEPDRRAMWAALESSMPGRGDPR